MKKIPKDILNKKGTEWDGYDEGYEFTCCHGFTAYIRRSVSCVTISRHDGQVPCLSKTAIEELIPMLQKFVESGTL